MKRGFIEVSEEFKKIKDVETILPTRGSSQSAGYDFYSKEDVVLNPDESHIFWTDVKSYMELGEVLELYVRSSIGIKKQLMLKNTVGIIDGDYFGNKSNDGNIGIALYNYGSSVQNITVGERIAQGIFKNFLVSDSGNVDKDRIGGIGSTN